MDHLINNITYTENLQEIDDNQSALDKVVDPSIEFELQYSSKVNSPNEAFNLPKPVRKHSLTSLRARTQYKVEDVLPKVHRSSSNQSVSMLRKDKLERNVSECSDFNGSDRTIHSSASNDLQKDVSSGACTPIPQDVSFSDDSPIFPNFNQDRLETASNISLNSNMTDNPRSNISSVSDLTGYEEELFQIKKLLIHGSNQSLYQPEFANPQIGDSFDYKHKIEELEGQLQDTLSENEKYKFDLKDLENKIELIWQEKFQEILRQKAQCEGQLENVKKQFENTLNEKEKLINNFKQTENKNTLRVEFSKLQLKLNNLEKQNSDLQSKFVLSCNESKQWQSEFLKTEAENEKFRVTLQEMKSEIESKNSILFGLKNKITEQHIELQNQIQAKMKLNNHILTLNNDIESVKKSEKWYTEQLHNCQMIKSNIQQDLMSTQTNLITATQKNENLIMEINHWKNISEETQRKAMREKEKLLRKVEMIEADILEREAILKCTENDSNFEINYISKTLDNKNYQLIIQDYEEQLTNLKKTIESSVITTDNLQKQNADYLVRLTTIQKNLNEKELSLQTIQNRNQDLEMKSNNFTEELRTKNNELLELRNKIVNLEVSLHASNREKEEIDEVVKNLRDDFNKFMKCYQIMKEKLDEKTRTITQFEHEKQELFMENNWRVCEIEELQHKILDSKKLQADVVELKNYCNEIILEKNDLENTNQKLLIENKSLQEDCDNLKEQIEHLQQNIKDNNNDKQQTIYENEILKLKEALKQREEQLFNQTKNYDLLNDEILEKDKFILSLQQKLSESTNSLQINFNLQHKINDLNKKLVDANSVIDQFNILCRNSEFEKYNLSNELTLLKRELELTKNPEKTNKLNKTHVDANLQTESQTDNYEIILELQTIQSKLFEVININNNTSNNKQNTTEVNNNKISDTIRAINDNLNKILILKEEQIRQLEDNKKTNKILRAKILKLRNVVDNKLNILNKRCDDINVKYQKIENIVENFNMIQSAESLNSIGTQTEVTSKDDEVLKLLQEVKNLKTLLRVNEMERKEHYKRFEVNNRTLLKKVKEHMKGRKTAEKKLSALEETYILAITEINTSKIVNNRLHLELETYKSRCNEYKILCDKLNENIIKLEKEKTKLESSKVQECLECLDKNSIKEELKEFEYKYKNMEEKLYWIEKEISDKDQDITECKKQIFNEKLQTSSLKKQLSSVQMCLDNANEQLDKKQLEFGHLKSVMEKLEQNEKLLTEQLENAHIQCQESKRKLESTVRLLEEKTCKDDILADEIKTLSCCLHQKTLEMSNLQNNYTLLESQSSAIQNNHQKIVEELHINLSELQNELDCVRNDKFFLQRLSADLKMSLQGTLNQNKVLNLRLETLEKETKDLTQQLKYDSLPSPSKIDEEYINRLLQQSTVVPTKPLKNLRSCLDSLKQEMATLQREIIAKTQSDISL